MKKSKTPPEGRAMTLKQLRAKYGVCYNTFKKMLLTVPGLELKPQQKLIYPPDLSKIFSHLDA